MATTTASRMIDAPAERVFETVAQIENFSKAIPHITGIEFLSKQRKGVGTRFRETRVMGGREATTELEVTEYVPNEKVRLVSESGGTTWDTVFTVHPVAGAGTELKMVMDSTPHKLMAKIVNPLVGPMVRKALEKDLDGLKEHCES